MRTAVGSAAAVMTGCSRTPEQQTVVDASIIGDRKTLKADAFIPLAMALIYAGLFVYFKSIGGYRAVHIEGSPGGGH